VQIFGSGLICPRSQTCCASPTQTPARLANSPGFKSFRCPRWRIKFSLERFPDQSRIPLRAQPLESSLGRVPQAPRFSHALRLELGNKCRKTTRVAQFRGSTLQCLCASACVPSRWKVLSGEFRRRPTALAIKFRKSDRVGRRGLSEPREDFSRLITYAWTQKWFVQFFGSGLICPRAQTCCAELRRLARLANSPGFKSFHCPRWRIKFSLERFPDQLRICLRTQPLESSLGRVPQAADGTCNKISQTGSCRSPRTV